ncbi:SIN1-domain-containing protein [Piromyces finnis]|uniref:SIN1-domain-containing protein n=1 Tax=Piromyces finnis TaxID=1754191 RepID=A0A1Y1VJT1_9FUNG|nr:SIN1-domain-containing protein [Piromyces finnis]|eukprot:ORX56646.1 SIN1-domain-containing protein [Piromyces finnis]
MSLLTDPSYLIYQMRLALINNDQTAKKIVTLPIYSEDDYLVYSNSPEDNTYSSSPNITMMGSDLYQSKKGKLSFSPFLGSATVRNQHPSQQQLSKMNKLTKSSQTSSNNLQPPPQRNESGKNISQIDSNIKVDAEQDKSNANNNIINASTLINKNLNSQANTNTSYINSTTNKTKNLMDDNDITNSNINNNNNNNNINNDEDSNSCRSTNSLQLDDEEDGEYNDSLSSSNDSSVKEPTEAPVITENLFIKQKHLLTIDGGRSIPKNKPLVSNLSQLLKQNNSSSNPFADYRFFCGKGDPDSMKLMIYLPFSDDPEIPLEIMVKKTANVEDVIGYSLYEYNEAERQPPITDDMDVPYWNMRIVEDDGEIDEDFPALERSRKIQKFAFDSFAICKASQAEISKNLTVRNAMQAKSITNISKPAADVAVTGDGSSKTYFIRVNLYSTLEVKQTTTQQFPSNMLLRDVFNSICQKRKYDIKDYVLKMADTKTDVPLDKTLEQAKLQEICVLKRDRGGAGDIFLRPPDEKDQNNIDSLGLGQDDYASIYKQWTVSYRHFMGKSECILIIDGEYIYITSNENKFLKKTSYHIGSVEMCRTHHKNNSIIKFIIKRTHDTKSYEFEAASSQEAEEICMRIKILNEKIKREHNL